MLFNSLQFIVFFIIVTLAYFSIRHQYRWILLLGASCYFYMAFVPIYILILGGTILVDYFIGILLDESRDKWRKLILTISIIVNIGVLVVFKYYNFFLNNIYKIPGTSFLHYFLPALSIILPIGLSFHTFQALSYTIEVYRKRQKAERHFGIYALYVMYYPQLVAGPIERPQNLLPQLRASNSFDFERLKSGLIQMAWGFLKKIVIADRLAMLVDHSYADVFSSNGLTLLVATIFYSFQIYCDFSGYADIAIGASRVMGIDLMANFRTPYLSKSIAEFWKRWHISLSTWFKDYVYIPLGGNKVKVSRWYFNLLIVFILSGFWHGANWTFIIWGLLHGIYLIFAIEKQKWKDKLGLQISLPSLLNKSLDIIITFSLVAFAWIFFRSSNVSSAILVISKIVRFDLNELFISPYNDVEFIFCIFLIIGLMIKEKWFYHINTTNNLRFMAVFLFLIIFSYVFGVFNYNQFIYFQF